MEIKIIIFLLGKIASGIAIAQLVPLFLTFCYGEDCYTSFIFSIAVALLLLAAVNITAAMQMRLTCLCVRVSQQCSFHGYWQRCWPDCRTALQDCWTRHRRILKACQD